VVVLVAMGGSMAMAGPFVILDMVRGSSYALIQGQMAVAQHRHLDLNRCQIEVKRDRTSAVVVFTEQGELRHEEQVIAVRTNSGMELNATELRALLTNPDLVESVDSIRGRSFQSIQSAMEVFGKQNRDLSVYKIEVAWDGETIIVMFSDKDRLPGTMGNTPGRPGFEVVLDPEDLHVVKSYFLR